jgi:Tfp pilus assembly protein PilZ
MDDFKDNDERSDVTSRLIGLIRDMNDKEREKLLSELEERSFGGKRRHRRKSFMMVVDYGDGDGSHLDFIQDISAGGVFIGTKTPFSIGQEITLTFPLPFQKEKVELTAEVVRTTPDGIGVRFKPLDPAQEEQIKSLLKII